MWQTERSNVQVKDVVLVRDSNQVRGNWRLTQVTKVSYGTGGLLQRIELKYKNLTPDEASKEYGAKDYVVVGLLVQCLILIAAADKEETV